MKKGKWLAIVSIGFIIIAIAIGCNNKNEITNVAATPNERAVSTSTSDIQENASDDQVETQDISSKPVIKNEPKEESTETKVEEKPKATADSIEYIGTKYTIIKVDGGDLSGDRQANVAVDTGYGDRIYWAFTNENGQLVNVIADIVILQDDSTEPVNTDGRYYDDEAKVPGTEQDDLDEGHVIADSLGGVSNAYNITPQNSILNRYGDQAYMEKVLRDAGGCENFVATITYLDTETQIPSHYKYEYDLKGERVVDEFDNINPDEVNITLVTEAPVTDTVDNQTDSIANIDTDGNGKVTIAEAKAAGYSMPIHSDNWLYKYMDDRDGDGMVGE